MKKLINLTVYDAKNMICVWNENEPKNGYRSGIALENAVRGFMVPRHYIVGVFDLGAKAFVRLELINNGNKISEKEARDNVYKMLLTSGVEIEDEARTYLIS